MVAIVLNLFYIIITLHYSGHNITIYKTIFTTSQPIRDQCSVTWPGVDQSEARSVGVSQVFVLARGQDPRTDMKTWELLPNTGRNFKILEFSDEIISIWLKVKEKSRIKFKIIWSIFKICEFWGFFSIWKASISQKKSRI